MWTLCLDTFMRLLVAHRKSQALCRKKCSKVTMFRKRTNLLFRKRVVYTLNPWAPTGECVNISLPEHTMLSNKTVLEMTKCRPFDASIRRRQLWSVGALVKQAEHASRGVFYPDGLSRKDPTKWYVYAVDVGDSKDWVCNA